MQKYFYSITHDYVVPFTTEIKSITRGDLWQVLVKVHAHFAGDSLYRNSIYLMLSTGVTAFFSFIFWMINTRIFPPEQVGLTTTILSVSAFLSSISLLGLNQSLIRYYSKSPDKNALINASFTVISIVAALTSIVYILFLKYFSPKLLFLQYDVLFIVLFIIFNCTTSLSLIIDTVLTARRSANYVLIRSIAFGIFKLFFTFLLLYLGILNIFVTLTLAGVFFFLAGVYILYRKFKYKVSRHFTLHSLKSIASYSLSNYIATFIGGIQIAVLPVLITNNINAATSAYFYFDMMIINLLLVIPSSASQSLFAEGSYVESELKRHTIRTLKIIALFMIPAITVILFFGKYILLLFGKSYSAEGTVFLQIMALSTFLASLNYVAWAVFRIKHKMKEIIISNGINTVITVGLSYLLISKGLVGVGIAGIFAEVCVCIYYFFVMRNIFIKN